MIQYDFFSGTTLIPYYKTIKHQKYSSQSIQKNLKKFIHQSFHITQNPFPQIINPKKLSNKNQSLRNPPLTPYNSPDSIHPNPNNKNEH